MSMTAVPISIVLVFAPQAASSGNGDPSWREVVHPEIGPVRAERLGCDGEVDGLQERVGAGARLRLRRRGPMAEGEEANFFHGHKADVSRLALSNPKLGLEQAPARVFAEGPL